MPSQAAAWRQDTKLRPPRFLEGLVEYLRRPLAVLTGALIVVYSAIAYAPSLRKRVVREVLYKQIYFTGVQPLAEVLLLAVLVGYLFVVLMERAHSVAGEASSRMLIHWLVMELSPFACGMIVLSRSGSAITSEIAGMTQKGEVRSLQLLGIDPESYLLVPRLFGVALGTMLLSFWFFVGCTLGGLTLSALFSSTSFERFFDVFAGSVNLTDLVYPPFKGAVTGMGIAAIGCNQGLHVPASSAETPKAVIATITHGTFFVLIANTLLVLVAS
jgi:phospholipid/cholesterol/gamma-HCH transport system permease protein